jgi:hypothetical protein
MRKPSIAVVFASLYLLAYYVLYYNVQDYKYMVWMFLGAPFVLGWMAYIIIRYGKYKGPELQENEEWGYSDKNKDSLGVF